jgi:transposase InsO family protein
MRKRKTEQFYFFKWKEIPTIDSWQLLRLRGKDSLSPQAQLKLEWIIFYHTIGKGNAIKTAAHFGINPKTLHKWKGRFDPKDLTTLEEESRAPDNTRQKELSFIQEGRITQLRRKHLRWGKMKIQRLYIKTYHEYISSWKIQRVVEEKKLYFDMIQVVKGKKIRKQAQKHKKKRITAFVKKKIQNHLWHVDTVVFTLTEGGYRYLITAIDELTKLAYARLYTTHSSKQAADFLKRLTYLTEGGIMNLHHDNGSEFEKDFKIACQELKLPQWYSRPRTPKDNPVLERFNRTIQEEFVEMIDIGLEDVALFNNRLLDWLIEYNNVRPHEALDYLTPLEYIDQTTLSPMSPSCT